ncbi:MAG: ribosomal protein S18-alanine N-acetyltransferase [Cyanobacteriota bacterium]|nr:ribosomal protein S18-alanine N-acetyltransferase [Cyanobacteriota bacterium]
MIAPLFLLGLPGSLLAFFMTVPDASALPYRLAPLTPSHLEAMLTLDHVCYGGYWSAQGYLDELERPNSLVWGSFWQANGEEGSPLSVDGESLVGFAILWQIFNEAHLISLAVHPRHRRRGIARCLLHQLCRLAANQGCEWATLEVQEDNQAARSLYENLGFQVVGRRKGYYSLEDGRSADALIYWKKPLL